jgi:tol-pal system protein YbgF
MFQFFSGTAGLPRLAVCACPRRNRLQVVARRILPGALAVFLAVLTGPAAARDSELALQLQRMRRDLSDLQAYIYSGKAPKRDPIEGVAPSVGGDGPSASRMQVQMQNLEGQMRELTGRIEEVEFGVNSIKDRLEKLIADVEQRFQALETGAGGQKSGSLPSGTTQATAATGTSKAGAAATGSQPITGVGPGGQAAAGKPLTLSRSGAKIVKPPAKSVPNAPAGSQIASAGKASETPRQQYDRAFNLLQRRDYANAATAFKGFVDGNPESPLASNALYWLGETHYFRKDYAEAARVFLDGYQKYPKGNKAADNLFKLGKSLSGINEKKPACAAWKKLVKSYPKSPKRLLANARSEMKRIGCS